VLLCLVTACGNSGTSDGADTVNGEAAAEDAAAEEADGSAVPTMPAARFAQPTTQIGAASSDGITETESLTATNETTETTEDEAPAPDSDVLARGEQAYARLCAECHGAAGEGVPEQGNPVNEWSSAQAEFVNLLRTGGDLGPDHLFGPQRISPESVDALYVYVQTLGASAP